MERRCTDLSVVTLVISKLRVCSFRDCPGLLEAAGDLGSCEAQTGCLSECFSKVGADFVDLGQHWGSVATFRDQVFGMGILGVCSVRISCLPQGTERYVSARICV